MPSYCSGVQMPRNPSFPSSSIVARGNSDVRSHSAAKGSIFSLANSRASSTTCSRTSVTVDIEPLAALPAELARRHHVLQQLRGGVLPSVPEPRLQDLEDRQTNI